MRAKLHFVLSITIFFIGFYGSAQQAYWKPIQGQQIVSGRADVQAERLFILENSQFGKVLSSTTTDNAQLLYFPEANGKMVAFMVKETPVLHPDLAKKYPDIRSFTGKSNDEQKKIRFSYAPRGMQATIVEYGKGTTTIIANTEGGSSMYKVYDRKSNISKSTFVCGTMDLALNATNVVSKSLVDDQVLRKFRIAVSATGEYTEHYGGTVEDALSGINATITRINEVFETDLGVTLEIVANNDQIIYTDAANDPYDNTQGSFNSQVQNTLTTVIGEENYDVGHLFHEDEDNGNAGFVGAVCVDNQKGSAFASSLIPEGDLYDLDYVAHELGHQFGANHTFSFRSEGTGVQAEPASGTTIMGYAGIVEGNNVAPSGDDYFHHNSIVQIQDYLETVGCSQNTTLTNNPPTIVPQSNYTIPKGTAFVLTADATDVDGDLLTYTWEQIDDGVVTASSFGPDNTSGANFRSLRPTTSPIRYFPRLSKVITGELEQINPTVDDAWETVSNIERQLNFAITVRDNNPEGGQVACDSVAVDVVNAAGPFLVSSQNSNEVYSGGELITIQWDVANTNLPPVNTEAVNIYLSTDGGASFPIFLAENIPNTGTATIQLPGTATTNARIMVKARDNIFFAVNSIDFTITESQAILNFEQLQYETCQPDAIIIPFVYETYGGFSETMDLSVNTSAAFSVSFSQNTVSTNGTTIDVTLGNTIGVAVGTYEVEIIAAGQSFSTSAILDVNIFDATYDDVVLTFPEDLATRTTVNPEFVWEDDVNYNLYDIEIATDNLFVDVVESATVAFNSYQSTNLLAESTYYWRVKPKNNCGEGSFGQPFSFTTSVVNCAIFDSIDSPIEIPAENASTITSKVTMAQDLKVSDVNVSLEIAHTYLEDMVVSLTSPSGTKVTLLSKNCGNQNNIIAVFDDEGEALTCSGNPAINGIIQPLGSLSSFNGESTLGEWVLEVEDTAASDGGSLDAFALEICVEGFFRPDDDEDGVFDDGDDLCLGTPKGTAVDTSGCPLNNFPANNFSVSLQSESCRDNNDGSITVLAQDISLDYTATLQGNGIDDALDFMEQTTFQNLTSGTYQLCITGTDGTINYRASCFDVIVEEPDPLSVFANLLGDTQQLVLNLSGGSLYNIELNGLVTQTLEEEVVVDLIKGLNTLKVSTGLTCQGVFEEQYLITENPIVFPNPASDTVTIATSFEGQSANVVVFTSEGRWVASYLKNSDNSSFDLDVSKFSNGVYYIVLDFGGIRQTCKMIKQ